METGQASVVPQAPPPIPVPSSSPKSVIRDTGYTVLYDGSGQDGTDLPVDIIFVHGLGGGPEKSWSKSRSSAPSVDSPEPSGSTSTRRRDQVLLKFRSAISSSKPNLSYLEEDRPTSLKDKIFWPLDFLPKDFPRSRILTWGYDSKVTADFLSGTTTVNQDSYHSHARNLLYDINESRAKDGRKRPIIWIAHSLGGIIVKQALLNAESGMGSSIHPLEDICQSTRGIIFLGTPHRGSSTASLGEIAARAVKAIGFDANDKILKQLARHSPELEHLRGQFGILMRKKNFYVGNFREEKGMAGIRGLRGKVVEDESSTIDDTEPIRTIPANHEEMSKFSDLNDTGYRRIKGDLSAIIAKIPDMARENVPTERERLISNLQHAPDSSVVVPLEPFDLSGLIPDLSIFGPLNLHNAIENGDESEVRKLLAMGVKIEDYLFGETGLGLAVTGGSVEVVNMLLERGADIESRKRFSRETPLMEAIKLKSYVMVDFLLRQGADVESTDRDGKMPIHIACESGDEAILDLLLQRKINIEATDIDGRTSLHIVAESGDEDIAKTLLNANANTEAKEFQKQRTPLHYAAQSGRLAIVKQLLQRQARVNAQDYPSGTTALHLAAESGHVEVVSYLVSRGASVLIPKHVTRTTALHLASENGHYLVVEVLIKGGADVTAKEYPSLFGKTSLHLAAQNGHHQALKLLLIGSNLEEQELWNGNTALLLATLGGHTCAAKTLLENHADIEAQNHEGMKALHIALREGHEDLTLLLLDKGSARSVWAGTEVTILQYAAQLGQTYVVQKLLDLGAEIEEQTPQGDTALQFASSAGQTTIVSLLLAKGAKFDTQNGVGLTALQKASHNGHESTVRLLLNCGANARLKDNTGRTALHDAASRGHGGVVKLLIDAGADSTTTDQNLHTPLHSAAEFGQVDVIKLLLSADPIEVINIQGSKGHTPLFFACQNGHESMTTLLLEEGAQVEAPVLTSPLVASAARGHSKIIDLLLDHSGFDNKSLVHALLAAAFNGHVVVIKKLLRKKELDINAAEAQGLSALHVASGNGHDDVIQLLLKEGADVDLRSLMGWSPIYGAALGGHTSAMRILLDAGSGVRCLQQLFVEDLSSLRRLDQEGLIRLFAQYAQATMRFFTSIKNCDIPSIRDHVTKRLSINYRDGNGNTALHVAAVSNCMEAIPILCDAGIDVDGQNFSKTTALHMAVLSKNIEAQRLLLQYGVNIDRKDYRGFTALHCAIYTEQEISVKLLLEAGVDVSIKEDMYGMTALQMAEERGYTAILPLLSG